MKIKVHIILRKCNVFKQWSIELLFPYNISRAKHYMEFRDLTLGLNNFIDLRRKVIVREIIVPNLSICVRSK